MIGDLRGVIKRHVMIKKRNHYKPGNCMCRFKETSSSKVSISNMNTLSFFSLFTEAFKIYTLDYK